MTLPPQFQAGARAEIGSVLFSERDIVRFARKYDPQPFHTDKDAARESVLGGLCASGWHTTAAWMRCQRDHAARVEKALAEQGFAKAEFGPAFGFRNLRWVRPVFVGDRVTFHNEISESRQSQSRPGWYVMTVDSHGVNQDGKLVIGFSSSVLLRYPA